MRKKTPRDDSKPKKTRRRVKEDIKGVKFKDATRKTGLSSFIKGPINRRQLLKMIRKDAEDMSRSLLVFSRYLENLCLRRRFDDGFLTQLGGPNGVRDLFKVFIDDPTIEERCGIELPNFKGMAAFRAANARAYGVAVHEYLDRNMPQRFKMFYEKVQGKSLKKS